VLDCPLFTEPLDAGGYTKVEHEGYHFLKFEGGGWELQTGLQYSVIARSSEGNARGATKQTPNDKR